MLRVVQPHVLPDRLPQLLDDRLVPLKDRTAKDIDIMVFRENTEGVYVGVGGQMKKGTPDEVATQEIIFTRKGVERVLRHAFETCRARNRRKREPWRSRNASASRKRSPART